jgi:hypothetical protein
MQAPQSYNIFTTVMNPHTEGQHKTKKMQYTATVYH